VLLEVVFVDTNKEQTMVKLVTAKSKESKDLPLGVVVGVLGGSILLIGCTWFFFAPKEGSISGSKPPSSVNLAAAGTGSTLSPTAQSLPAGRGNSAYKAYFADLSVSNLPKLSPPALPTVSDNSLNQSPGAAIAIAPLPSVPGLPGIKLPPLPAPPVSSNLNNVSAFLAPPVRSRGVPTVTITPPASPVPKIALIGGSEASVNIDIDGQRTDLVQGVDGPKGIRLIEAHFGKERYQARIRLSDGSINTYVLALPPEQVLMKPGKTLSTRPIQEPTEEAPSVVLKEQPKTVSATTSTEEQVVATSESDTP
jgi:hypothetical protein